MSDRRWALALVALLAAACPAKEEESGTSLLIDFKLEGEGPRVEYLNVTWVGNGKVNDTRAPLNGPLPDPPNLGTLRIAVREPIGARLIVARGYANGDVVAEGVLKTPVARDAVTNVTVNLSRGRMADGDGDGIPDLVDNCPTEINPAQQEVSSCPMPPDGGAPPDAEVPGDAAPDAELPADTAGPPDARPDTAPIDLGSGKSPRGSPCVGNDECETGRCADSRVGKFCASPGMLVVPAGMFMRGCLAKDTGCAADERPQRAVMVSGFELSQTEVTQSEYDVCVKGGACLSPAGFNPVARPKHPVGNVTWAAANSFCTWSGKRLPTEAEWEKAARGPAGTIYPWGDDPPKTGDCSVAQYKACAPADSIAVNQLIGTSGYGIEDMGGNVAEWVNDFYSANYYAGAPATDPTGPASGPHLRRGGGFASDLSALRTSARASGDAPAASTGFRCARSL